MSLQRDVMAQAELDRCVAIARDRYGFAAPVAYAWDLRGLTGGYVYRGETTLHLNAHLADNEGEAYAQTVAHEFAHVVTYWRWNKAQFTCRRLRSHGYEWQSVMAAFGRPATRCHNYASAERVRTVARVFTYRCACKDHLLTAIRHNRAVKGARYRCVRCRRPLVLA
jgi:SprT protein